MKLVAGRGRRRGIERVGRVEVGVRVNRGAPAREAKIWDA